MGEKSSKREFRDMLLEMLEDSEVQEQLRQALNLTQPDVFSDMEKASKDASYSSEACPEQTEKNATLLQEKDALQGVIHMLHQEAQVAADQAQENTKEIDGLQRLLCDVKEEKRLLAERLQASEHRESELQDMIQALQQAKQESEEQWQEQRRQFDVQMDVLREEVRNLETKIRFWQGENAQLQDKAIALEQRLGPVKPWQEAYALYQKLPVEIQTELQGIFTISTLDGFIACGVQSENIWSLWEYAQIKCQAGEARELPVLQSLLDFFLSQHNLTFAVPRYVAQVVQAGEEFDVAKHIRSRDSKAAGRITDIFLQGYENRQTGKIVKKSIVRV